MISFVVKLWGMKNKNYKYQIKSALSKRRRFKSGFNDAQVFFS